MINLTNTIAFIQTSLELNANNINSENKFIRETFLELVADYYVHLVTTNEKVIAAIKNYNLCDEITLNALVNQLITEMDFGLVPEKDEELYENMLIILTMSIKDKPKKLVRTKASFNKFLRSKFDKKKNICYN